MLDEPFGQRHQDAASEWLPRAARTPLQLRACVPGVGVWDNAAGKSHVRTFPSYEAARSWRHEVLVVVRRRGTVAPGRYELPTVAEALDALIDGMSDGTVLDRSGKEYKPATIRSYEQASRRYLKSKLGRHRLDALERGHVQMLVDALRRKGLKPSTVHNKLDPLRVVYRRAVNRDIVSTDPTANLELPLVRGRRERVVSRERARLLLASGHTVTAFRTPSRHAVLESQ